MAKTTKSNKSGKAQPKKGQSRKKNSNSSDDTLKFLLVLVIAGIAIALIIFSQKDEEAGNVLKGTPTPTVGVEQAVTPTPAEQSQNQGTTAPTPTKTPEETLAPEITPTATPTPEPTATVTPTPTPAVTADEARATVEQVVDTGKYNLQLINDHLMVGNGEYYQFSAIVGQEFIYPFLVVSKADGSLHFFDSTDETVFDFTTFPLEQSAAATPTPVPVEKKELTAEEAYKILCSYSRDSLKIAKDVAEYNAEYDSELTLINGVNCYRFNLSEVSGGKVRNRGEFFVSVDGTKCYYLDSDTNEFIPAQK